VGVGLVVVAGVGQGRLLAESCTRVAIEGGRWTINGAVTHAGARAEGLLMNVRMINAAFEDTNGGTRPAGFDPNVNTEAMVARVEEYVAHGVRAFTVGLQGGSCGYEGAANSAFGADGSLKDGSMARVRRVIDACDRAGAVVILSCFYQRQDQVLEDEAAVRAAVAKAAGWVKAEGFGNVLLEVANEFPHAGFDHGVIRGTTGQVELMQVARAAAPGLLVSASGLGDGVLPREVAEASDFLLPHFNGTAVRDIPARLADLRRYGKPIVCNEDDKTGAEGVAAAEACVAGGASWGLMLVERNQHYPFTFGGAADDPMIYGAIRSLTTAATVPGARDGDYFPPAESEGGWRVLGDAESVRRVGGMDPEKLDDFRRWLLESDDRPFAAVVVRRGHVVLEVERGNSAKTDARRVASVSKAICATVLAIASERSQQGRAPRVMRFDDPAFPFLPWAQPLSDPRKARITVKQLLNHTSGLCPEATGAPNDGSWDYILGRTGDPRTAALAFDPGTACGYSTHALDHAGLVCEAVTGKPYDSFAIEALFKPLGIEHWTFSAHEGFRDGVTPPRRHVSHGLGLPARALARIAYCLLRNGRWNDQQVVPGWFVQETAAPTHQVTSEELRFKLPARTFSHGWELPSERGEVGRGIPADARFKPGSGGQLIAFVPSLDLVVARQTGGSGPWEYEEALRRACSAVLAQ
jgi:CubicO group peptidase (beta-lactamase class C family)